MTIQENMMTTPKYTFKNHDKYCEWTECDENGFDREGVYQKGIRHDWVPIDADPPEWYRPEWCEYCDCDIFWEEVPLADRNYNSHVKSEKHKNRLLKWNEKNPQIKTSHSSRP